MIEIPNLPFFAPSHIVFRDTGDTDYEALLNDPYCDPNWILDYPVRWAPPPGWWRERDEQGVRETVAHYGDKAGEIIAARLTTTEYRPDGDYDFEALNEDAPLWKLVRDIEKNNPRSKVDFAGEANYALGRFLARLNPGSKYREKYFPLYSYVFDRWAMRYVRNWIKRTRDRAITKYIWNFGGYEASPPKRRAYGNALREGESLDRSTVITLPRTWSAVHGTDEEREWFARASARKTEPCPLEKRCYWPKLVGFDIADCRDHRERGLANFMESEAFDAFARTLPGWHADAVRLWAAGQDKTAIAEQLGVTRRSVYSALKSIAAKVVALNPDLAAWWLRRQATFSKKSLPTFPPSW
jgi:hypothetical protein